MAGSVTGNIPKSYSLNMFKDFVPMCIFSETSQGKDMFNCFSSIFRNGIGFLNFANITFVLVFNCDIVQ